MSTQLSTQALHAGHDVLKSQGTQAVPIYQTTSYVFNDSDHAASLFSLAEPGYIYTRLNNPTNDVLEQRLAALEGGVAAVATASGTSAIATSLMVILRTGDHIVASNSLYGGTYNLLSNTLTRFGITTTFVDPDDPTEFTKAVKSNTRAFFAESLGNPKLDVLDLKAAKKVADYIGTVHHEIIFTIQEGLDAIKDVIYHLETYDVTTIRASTPMFLMARVIKSMGIKMVLSGEGSDEIFGGYLYFHKAPNDQEFHEETVRKLDKLHQYDCLRANKALASWGIEGRVPFLDKEFMDVAMNINPKDKMITSEKMEKWLLRKAFEDLLPEEVAWRQKEQFSDGVGYSWIDTLKELVEDKVSDDMMAKAKKEFSVNPPMNKEEYYYRTIFNSHFPSDTAAKTVPSVPSVACSSPTALKWDSSFQKMNDPSGRAIKTHQESY